VAIASVAGIADAEKPALRIAVRFGGLKLTLGREIAYRIGRHDDTIATRNRGVKRTARDRTTGSSSRRSTLW
jgi:hypothetical protein